MIQTHRIPRIFTVESLFLIGCLNFSIAARPLYTLQFCVNADWFLAPLFPQLFLTLFTKKLC